ncbi:NAD:arginine ADP-ribosyltransferase with a RelA/SpoT domain protein, partial [Saccharopolyspora kobensis]
MSIEMPDEVKWLLPIVVGQSWPEGDEDAMRRMADAWRTAADGIGSVNDAANRGAEQAKGAMEGQTSDAFAKLWKDIGDGGEAALPKLKEACEKLAKACDDAALDVEHTKLTIIASLIALAIQIAAMIAAAPVTFGASTAGVAAAQAVTRTVVMQIFRQLVMSILKNVAIEIATSVAIEFAVQGVQIASGERDGFDGGKFKDAAISGAIGGAVGGVFEGAGKAFGKQAGEAVGDAAGGAATTAGRAAGDAAG